MIVIDMDMPNNCAECPIHTDALSKVYCEITHKCVGNAVACYERMKKCPIKCDIEDIKAEIEEYKDDKVIHAERNEMIDIVLDIIKKHCAEQGGD